MDFKMCLIISILFIAIFLSSLFIAYKFGKIKGKDKGEIKDVKKSSKLVDEFCKTKEKFNGENHSRVVDNFVKWLSDSKKNK